MKVSKTIFQKSQTIGFNGNLNTDKPFESNSFGNIQDKFINNTSNLSFGRAHKVKNVFSKFLDKILQKTVILSTEDGGIIKSILLRGKLILEETAFNDGSKLTKNFSYHKKYGGGVHEITSTLQDKNGKTIYSSREFHNHNGDVRSVTKKEGNLTRTQEYMYNSDGGVYSKTITESLAVNGVDCTKKMLYVNGKLLESQEITSAKQEISKYRDGKLLSQETQSIGQNRVLTTYNEMVTVQEIFGLNGSKTVFRTFFDDSHKILFKTETTTDSLGRTILKTYDNNNKLTREEFAVITGNEKIIQRKHYSLTNSQEPHLNESLHYVSEQLKKIETIDNNGKRVIDLYGQNEQISEKKIIHPDGMIERCVYKYAPDGTLFKAEKFVGNELAEIINYQLVDGNLVSKTEQVQLLLQ